MAMGVQYGHPRMRCGKEEQKTAQHKYIFMEGYHQKKDKSNLGGTSGHRGRYGGP